MDISNSALITSSSDVLTICQPFFDSLNLNYFVYGRLYNDGSFTGLTSAPQFIKHFFEMEFLAGGYIQQTGVFPWACHLPEQAVSDARNHFNHENGITFMYKREDSIEFFDFAAPKDNRNILYHYINNKDVFESFFLDFEDKASKLISNAEKERIIMSNNMLIKDDEILNELAESLTQTIKPRSYQLKNPEHVNARISQAEMNCLLSLSKGKTAKETAKDLFISPRTVNTHIYNIKNRLNVCSKEQVLNIMRENFRQLFSS
jgi:DNA-binding CsgD family transcriptional regulator